MAADQPIMSRAEQKELRRQERLAREEAARKEYEGQERESRMVWLVEMEYGGEGEATLSVWNEGPNAALGTIADLMEYLLDGAADRIVLTRTEMPTAESQHFPNPDARAT
jgi:hypothetical protein